jgi:hypothetical protein
MSVDHNTIKTNNGTLAPNSTIEVNVAGSDFGGSLDNIPSNATAVVLEGNCYRYNI